MYKIKPILLINIKKIKMFSSEMKLSFSDRDLNMNNFINSSKYKLTQLNELKWINYFLIQITFFQLIFFGIFSLFSIALISLQLYLFYQIYNKFKVFPVYESSEIERISCEINAYSNKVQFTFLINVIEFILFVSQILSQIGKDLLVGPFADKFYRMAISISALKIIILFLIKYKINKVNMRTEIINDL